MNRGLRTTRNKGKVTGTYGTLTLQANGSYTYAANLAAADTLAAGVTAQDVFTYAVSDGNGGLIYTTLTVTVTGVNDAPVARDDYNSVQEAATQTSATSPYPAHYGLAEGTATFPSTGTGPDILDNDSDLDGAPVVTSVTTPDTVTLSVNFGGSANSIKNDADLVTAVEVFDGATWRTLTTETGANVLVSSFTGSGNTLSVVLTDPTAVSRAITDYSLTAPFNLRVAIASSYYVGSYTGSTEIPGTTSPVAASGETSITGKYGTLYLQANGAYKYFLTSNALFDGDRFTEEFSYTISDGRATSSATLHVVVLGRTALTMQSEVVSIAEGSSLSADVVRDLDSNDRGFGSGTSITSYAVEGVSGTPAVGTPFDISGVGMLTINADGTYAFTPAADYNGVVPLITYTVSDGATTGSATLQIAVTPVNDAPVLDLDGSASGSNFAATYTENGPAVPIADLDDSITDVDSTHLDQAVITLTNAQAGDQLNYSALPAGITASVNTSVLGEITVTLSGSATLADYQTALRAVVFNNTSEAPDTTSRVINVQVRDTSGGLSNVAQTTLTVTSVNDAPVLDLDGNVSGFNYTGTYTNGAAGVSVADIDSDISDVDGTNVTSATITLTNPQTGDALNIAGLPTGIGISANVDTTGGVIKVTLTGSATLADYEAAIEAITFASTGTSLVDRTINVQVSDGVALSNTATTTLVVSPDNRPLTVTGTVVNEASPYVMFTVDGEVGQWVSLELAATTNAAGNATIGGDVLNNLEYFNGTTWVAYSSGLVSIPATVAGGGANTYGVMLVRTAVTQDSVFETTSAGYESLRLIARNAAGIANATSGAIDALNEGLAQIRDDGAGGYFAADDNDDVSTVPSGVVLDDDRALTVSNVTVNEGSPYAVFTVTGGSNQSATLSLTQNGDGSYLTSVQYFDPTANAGTGAWVDYTAGNLVNLDGGGSLLVRVALSPEQETTLDGPETFKLIATNTGGTTSSGGLGTIKDDGSGDYFAANNNTATPAVPTGTVLDDDRAMSVSNVTVNEGSPYAVFTVTGAASQNTTLGLANQNGDGKNLTDMQYFDGSAWKDYTTGAVVSLDGTGKLLVRVALNPEQEAAVDGPETFTLAATNTSGTVSTGGLGTIKDDGTGDYFAADNKTATPAVPAGVVLDDDRVLGVSDVTVNEGSPYAVFTVTGGNNQQTTLGLANQNGDGKNLADLQYFDGSVWKDYTAGAVVSLDGTGKLLVRVALNPEQEFAVDGPETFTLVATNTGGTVSTGGLGTIKDDGTGDYFAADNKTAVPAVPAGVQLDDDRALSIAPVTVNEGSPYAVFTVSGAAGQKASLGLADQNADGSNLGTLEVFDGTSWQPYKAGDLITLDANGKALVRVAISPEQETDADGPETFSLVATNTGGGAAKGTGTIVDDGTGDYFAADNKTATPAVPAGVQLDDDRPITVKGGEYNEASPWVVFTVNANPGQLITLDVRDAAEEGKAPTGDDEGNPDDSLDKAPIYYSLDGGKTWTEYKGVPFAAGEVPVLVAVDITNERDTVFEGEEQLQLVVSCSGHDYAGYASILDDGTGDLVAVDEDGDPRIDSGGNPFLDMSAKDDDRPKPILITPQALVIAAQAPIQLPPELPQREELPPPPPVPAPEVPPHSLMLFGGITDQFVESGRPTSFALPADAFVHTQPDALLTLTAKQADGSDLPEWIQFDPQSRTFQVNPPPGFSGEIKIMVIARDSEGREATAPFRFFVGTKQQQSAVDAKPMLGRASLSEKLLAAKRVHAMGVRPEAMPARELADSPLVKERKVAVKREVAKV